MDNCHIEIDVSGARRDLKEDKKRYNKEPKKIIRGALGYGEGIMKNLVPVDTGFMKNSIHSALNYDDTGDIYVTVVYARVRNKINYKNPDRKGFIEKTHKKMTEYINRIV